MIDVIVGPIEPLQIVIYPQNTVISVGNEERTVFVVNAGIPGPVASVPAWLDALPEYVSNYEAIHTGGLGLNDWYLAALGHMTVQSGVPIRILELE